jgi:SAM-dependent methyltransferase
MDVDILNIGAGRKPTEGAVNLDWREEVAPDVVWDLNVLPWPFDDETFDFIVARAILEHLDHTLIVSMDECWRVLRPGGRIYVKLPYWHADVSYIDSTHRWRFSLRSLDVFDPVTRYGKEYHHYTDRKWQIVKAARFNKARTSIHTTLEVRKPWPKDS